MSGTSSRFCIHNLQGGGDFRLGTAVLLPGVVAGLIVGSVNYMTISTIVEELE
jgi:hypothetical protein